MKYSFFFLFFSTIVIFSGGFAFHSHLGPTVAWAKSNSWSQQHYRRMTRSIFQRYQAALRDRFRQPCRSRKAWEEYQTWLQQLRSNLPTLALRSHHRRYLHARVRRYLGYAKAQHRYTDRRCRKEWEQELKRRNQRLNQRCQSIYSPTLQEEAAVLWVGVTPWAYVYLNNQLCGIAPLYARLKPGPYTLRLDYPPGQDTHQAQLQLVASKHPFLVVREMDSLPSASRQFHKLLAPQQLKWVLQKHQTSFTSCRLYAPSISRVFLSWQIDSRGKSSEIQWERPTDTPPRFQQCIIRALQRISFPLGKGIARIHSYEIKLHSTETPGDSQ